MDARWPALAVLTIARISMGFQFQSLALISPLLRKDFGISYADVGFLIGLYMSPGIFLAAPGGMLGRRFGDKRMVCFALALMTLGGVVVGFAENYATILVGRLLSGAGGVLLNVLMTKMVTDWFAGREIVLAMAIFINSFPIGIGLALLTLGSLAEVYGWQIAPQATAALALVSLLLVLFVYRKHVNDGQTNVGPSGDGIRQREVVLVCIAGAIWGIFNGAHSIMVGFTPVLLIKAGLAAGTVGFWVGLSTWLIVLSVQIGGIVAQRWGHANILMVAGIFGWGSCLLLLPSTDHPEVVLVVIGLLQGLPVGVIMALPATALRPQSRGIGMGFFFTWLYLGHAGLPPIAGWLQDLSGSAAAPLCFAAGLVFFILALFVTFRFLQREPTVAVQPA